MILDHWLIIAIASLAIAFNVWTAFFAIYWRGVAQQQNHSAKLLADWINDTLPELLIKENDHAKPVGDNRDESR